MAATLTQGGELTFLSFPIEKTETTADGDLIVYGKATDGSVDSDEQIVDPDFSAKAIQEWLATGPNLRVQHQSQRDPAGVGIEAHTGADGDTWVKSLVVETEAKRLVKAGALRAYSVGISRPKIVRDSVARGGRIVDGQIVEISLVDRPANKNCGIQLVKSDKDGHAEWVGKMFGDSDVLTKAEGTVTIDLQGTAVSDDGTDSPADRILPPAGVRPRAEKSADTVSVDLPKDVSVSFSPTDLAKLLEHRKVAEERVLAGDIAEKRQMDPDVGGGADRDKIPAKDFAGRNRSFPIVTPGDVSDAASSIGRAGADNYSSDKLKSNIIRIARRKGDAFVAELPDSWKGVDSDLTLAGDSVEVEKGKKAKNGKKPAFEGAAPSFGDKTANKDDEPSDDDGEDDTSDDAKKPSEKSVGAPESVKKDKVLCPGCGANIDDKHNFCPECGNKVPSGAKPVSKNHDFTCLGCGKNLDKDEKYCPGCGKENPGYEGMNTKGHNPGPGVGVAGSAAAADIEAVPAHREPDDSATESFESDTHFPNDNEEPSMKAAMRLKSVGAPNDMGALHDILCPAFHPEDAVKAHPSHSISGIDTGVWQQKALDAAVSAPLDVARNAARLWENARTLKSADPELVEELRAEAFKSFQDANPGPGSSPRPTEMSPTRFKRPYISEGHANPGLDHDGPNTHSVPSRHMGAEQFGRAPLASGHASVSPSNKNTAIIEPAPLPPGMSRTYYRNAERDAARSAMSAMHDHIAQTFPDICAMDGPGMGGEPPTGARPVPLPVGASKSEDEPVVKKSKKSKKASKDLVTKSVSTSEAQAEDVAELRGQVEMLTKSLQTERARTDKLQELIDSLSDLPDPRESPFKGVAQNALIANKTASALPVGARTVAESAEQAQLAIMQEMQKQWRNDPDPVQREAAWDYLCKMNGLPTVKK